MKILLIGDGNHPLLATYSIWLKEQNPKMELDILSFKEVDKKNSYSKIYPIKVAGAFNKFPKIRSLAFYIKIYFVFSKIFSSYDVIHFHMASPSIRFLTSKKCRAKKILTFWGSDFYNAGPFRKKLIKSIIDNVDELTCTNPQMAEDICNTFKIERTFKILTYIIQPLEDLKKIAITIDELKTKIGIDTDKVILTIGSNNNRNQNHLQIINELIKIKDLNKKVFIIVPLTYGRAGQDNITRIKEILTENNFTFKLITEFMSSDEVASLRFVTDVFIQLQTTDQLSGAMTEHMYAKNLVVTGSWLPYAVFKENNVYFKTIDKFTDLNEAIENSLTNLSAEKLKTEHNSKIINEMFGGENVIKKWSELYR